jgi:ABC-type dipeptide/oligopeptide/nickel transport system permease subunit
MWSALSARLAEIIVGLFVAGLVVGVLVPALGRAIGPATALAIALLCVTGVLWLARIIRGRTSVSRPPR